MRKNSVRLRTGIVRSFSYLTRILVISIRGDIRIMLKESKNTAVIYNGFIRAKLHDPFYVEHDYIYKYNLKTNTNSFFLFKI